MIRLPENLSFANNNTDLFKAWADYFTHYRVINFGKTGSYDESLTLEQKSEKLTQAINAEVNKLINYTEGSIIPEAVFKMSRDYREKAFAVINVLVDMVIPDVVADAYGRFSEIRSVGFGDNAVFDIKSSDLFYVSKNGNSRRHVTAQRQFTGQQALIAENRSITVECDVYRILCGKESLAEYAMKVALAMEAEIAKDIYAALSNSYNSLTSNFKEAAFTRDAFLKLRNRVSAANGGAKVFVYGTDLALADVLPSDNYLKMGLGEDYNKIGFLPVYMNTSLIALPQKINWASEDYDFAISDDELFFISSGTQLPVKVVIEGNSLAITDEIFSTANGTVATTIHKRWKVGVITNSRYAIMKI